MARETHRDTSTVNESLQHGKLRIVVRRSPLIERFCPPCLLSAGAQFELVGLGKGLCGFFQCVTLTTRKQRRSKHLLIIISAVKNYFPNFVCKWCFPFLSLDLEEMLQKGTPGLRGAPLPSPISLYGQDLQRGLHHTHTYSDGLRYECKQHLIFSASASTKGRTKSKSILPALFKCSSTKTGAIPATNFSSSCPSSACKPATEVAAIWKIHSLQIQKALISKIPWSRLAGVKSSKSCLAASSDRRLRSFGVIIN